MIVNFFRINQIGYIFSLIYISRINKSIEKAKLLHDDLEKYYIEAMNFSEIDTFAHKLERRIYDKE